MKKFIFTILAASAVAACNGGRDTAPDGAAAPVGGVAGADTAVAPPAAEVPGDIGTAGRTAGDATGTTNGTAPSAGTPASPGAAAAGGTTPPAAPGAGTATAPSAPPQAAAAAEDGAAILRRAAAAYENVRALRADFIMNFENPLLRQRLTSRGTLYQRQPDRLALRFTDPDGDLIVGDGQYFWVYYPSNNPQQVVRAPAAAAGESGVNLQAQFVGNPVERFSHTLEGSESVGGRQAHVLTLVPRQRAEYRSLKVWIDGQDHLARRFEITEHNGSVRRFDLQNMQVNPSIPDAVFRFTPPDGVRVVSAG